MTDKSEKDSLSVSMGEVFVTDSHNVTVSTEINGHTVILKREIEQAVIGIGFKVASEPEPQEALTYTRIFGNPHGS